jgi:hypothetical protein
LFCDPWHDLIVSPTPVARSSGFCVRFCCNRSGLKVARPTRAGSREIPSGYRVTLAVPRLPDRGKMTHILRVAPTPLFGSRSALARSQGPREARVVAKDSVQPVRFKVKRTSSNLARSRRLHRRVPAVVVAERSGEQEGNCPGSDRWGIVI